MLWPNWQLPTCWTLLGTALLNLLWSDIDLTISINAKVHSIIAVQWCIFHLHNRGTTRYIGYQSADFKSACGNQLTRNTIIKQYCNCVVKVLVKVGTSISAVYYDLPLTSWLPALPVSSAVPPSLMCGHGGRLAGLLIILICLRPSPSIRRLPLLWKWNISGTLHCRLRCLNLDIDT